LPADHQRPPAHQRRGPDRLPIPAEPRETPPPAEVRPRRGACDAEESRPDRSAVRLPVHRAAVLLFDRTRTPRRDDPPADHRPAALPRRLLLHRTDRNPRVRPPRPHPTSPPHQRPTHRADLRAATHTTTSTTPGPTRSARQRLHQPALTRPNRAHGGRIRPPRRAERELNCYFGLSIRAV